MIYLEDILKDIHKAYYDLYDQMTSEHTKESAKSREIKSPDLKNVIPYVKRKVFQGVAIVFSGVVPTHISLEKSKVYMVAKSLGAKVQYNITKVNFHQNMISRKKNLVKFTFFLGNYPFSGC